MRNEKPATKTATPSYLGQRGGVYGGFASDSATIPRERTQQMGEPDYGVFIPTPPSSNTYRSRSQMLSSEQKSEDRGSNTCRTLNPSYRGYSGGSRIRRYRCDNSLFRQSQGNRLIRNYSSYGSLEGDENNLYYTEGEPMSFSNGGGNSNFVRSASLLAYGLEGPHGSSHNSALCGRFEHHYDSKKIQTSLTSYGTERSRLDVPIHLAAVLSNEQAIRLRSCLNSSSPSKNGAKMKVLELLQYWLSDERTSAAIDGAITDAFRNAGIENLYTIRDAEVSNECHTSNQFPESTSTRVVVQGVKSVDSDTTSSCSSTPSERNSPELQRQVCEQDISISGNGAKRTTLPLHPSGSSPDECWASPLPCRSPPATPSIPQISAAIPTTMERCLPNRPLATSTQVVGQKKVSVVVATLDEIPRFYHPCGAPLWTEESLVGPHSKKRENPHLNVVDGVVLPAAVYDTQEDKCAMMRGLAPPGRKAKTVPIASLKAIDDRDVPQFIQNEFSRLPSQSRTSHGSRLFNSLGRGFLGVSNSSLLIKQGNYKQQLVHVVQRICTQCLGLPKYFAFLIIRILQYGADSASTGTVSFRGNTSPGASPNSSATESHSTITAQAMRELFEKHLRGHCIVRRLFVIFQLSSFTTSTMSACSDTYRIGTEQKYQPRPFLLPEDFRAYTEVLLDHHPGLAFLKQTPDFQSKYLETVIYRIFYDIDRLDRGRITYAELENSRLPDALRYVDASDDINTVLLYFSYEHFYVLYCRFWELDEDRDMLISRQEFMKYSPENVMNPLIADRIFAGVGRRIACSVKNCIGYEDFVWFCLSEEDKSTPTAIRYWFRILDLDGDGLLSAYELQIFYEATREKTALFVPDGAVSFENIICQIFDLFDIKACRGLRLADLLAKPEASFVALNMVTNVVRFLLFEHRDPLVSHQERLQGGVEQTPWDRFARAEYDCMAHEVTGE